MGHRPVTLYDWPLLRRRVVKQTPYSFTITPQRGVASVWGPTPEQLFPRKLYRFPNGTNKAKIKTALIAALGMFAGI